MGNNLSCFNNNSHDLELKSSVCSTPQSAIESKSAIVIQNQFRAKKSVSELKDNVLSLMKKSLTIEEISLQEFENRLSKSPIVCYYMDKMESEILSSNTDTNSKLLVSLILAIYSSSDRIEVDFYSGQIDLSGKKTGLGKLNCNDGASYYGYFKDDLFSGFGLYVNSNGDYYLGEWENGKSNGQGLLAIGKDTVKYNGSWVDNKKEGEGVESYIDGSVYKGNFKDNEKHGHGIYTFPDGSSYIGNFERSLFNGKGEYIWADGRKYVGMFKDNKLHGLGEHEWRDGSKYVGEYVHDMKKGYGEYTWSNGKMYKGYWVNNKPHGNGKIIENERQFDVVFRFGKPIAIEKVNDMRIEDDNTVPVDHNGFENKIPIEV